MDMEIANKPKDYCANPKCGKELVHTEGRRKKKYCNAVCKLIDWQRLHPGKRKPKTKRLSIEEYEKLIAIQKSPTSQSQKSTQSTGSTTNQKEKNKDEQIPHIQPANEKETIKAQITVLEQENAKLGKTTVSNLVRKANNKKIEVLKRKLYSL